MSLAQLDAITEDKALAHRPAKTTAPRPLRGIIHHGDCLATMKTMPACWRQQVQSRDCGQKRWDTGRRRNGDDHLGQRHD